MVSETGKELGSPADEKMIEANGVGNDLEDCKDVEVLVVDIPS